MTNTLTWGFNPTQLSKVNSNLLAVISIILLFMIAFLTVDVIASHCEEIKEDLAAAVIAEAYALGALSIARKAVKAAGATGIPWLIKAAVAALAAAYVAVLAISVVIGYLLRKLYECEKEHGTENDAHAAGGCVSGGCNA